MKKSYQLPTFAINQKKLSIGSRFFSPGAVKSDGHRTFMLSARGKGFHSPNSSNMSISGVKEIRSIRSIKSGMTERKEKNANGAAVIRKKLEERAKAIKAEINDDYELAACRSK